MNERIKDLEEVVKNLIDVKIKGLEANEKELEDRIQKLTENNLDKVGDKKNEKTNHVGMGKKNSFICRECNLKFTGKKELRIHLKEKHRQRFECGSCEKTFDVRCKLESHQREHENSKKFKCDKCDKTFVSEWRSKKHIEGHSKSDRKYCHFFNNRKFCPYEEIGCKFRHEDAGKCALGKSCCEYMCQFDHRESTDSKADIFDNSRNSFCVSEQLITSTPKKPEIDNLCSKCAKNRQCCNRCKMKNMLGDLWESFAKNLEETDVSLFSSLGH